VEAGRAVQESNATLRAVDYRLAKVGETISLLEAKADVGFSAGFLVVAANLFLRGGLLLAASLAVLGLLSAGALVVTTVTLPQVKKLHQAALAAFDRLDGVDEGDREFPTIVDPLGDRGISWTASERGSGGNGGSGGSEWSREGGGSTRERDSA
jgi:hypothetical protein